MNNELLEKLMKMNHLLRRWHRSERHNTPFEEHAGGQGRIIRLLQMQPAIATKDLSYLLDIRQQSLNEQLNKLEKAGYVVRKPSDTDKRVMIVHLTEAGAAVKLGHVDSADLFDGFTEEEMNSFAACIDKLTSVLEEKTASLSEEERRHWEERAERRMGKEQFHRLKHYRDFAFMDDMPHPEHHRGPRPEHMLHPEHCRGRHPAEMPHPEHRGPHHHRRHHRNPFDPEKL